MIEDRTWEVCWLRVRWMRALIGGHGAPVTRVGSRRGESRLVLDLCSGSAAAWICAATGCWCCAREGAKGAVSGHR